MSGEGAHLVLYDGVCGLCDRLLHFLFHHDQRQVFRYAALQSDAGRTFVARHGGDPGALSTFYVVANFHEPHARLLAKSDAAVFVAGQLGWPWSAFRFARALPRPLRDAVYDVIARTRYRVFGKFDACPVPSPEFRSRFIDGGGTS